MAARNLSLPLPTPVENLATKALTRGLASIKINSTKVERALRKMLPANRIVKQTFVEVVAEAVHHPECTDIAELRAAASQLFEKYLDQDGSGTCLVREAISHMSFGSVTALRRPRGASSQHGVLNGRALVPASLLTVPLGFPTELGLRAESPRYSLPAPLRGVSSAYVVSGIPTPRLPLSRARSRAGGNADSLFASEMWDSSTSAIGRGDSRSAFGRGGTAPHTLSGGSSGLRMSESLPSLLNAGGAFGTSSSSTPLPASAVARHLQARLGRFHLAVKGALEAIVAGDDVEHAPKSAIAMVLLQVGNEKGNVALGLSHSEICSMLDSFSVVAA